MSELTSSTGPVPLVSVLMPVRGCRDTLPMAVASVLAQTLDDWELLLVHDDDGAGLEWVTDLGDGRIRVLPAPAPGGRGAARQAGLEAARGGFLAFLDADDWMLPDRLQHQVELLEDFPDLSLVSGGMYVLDLEDRPAGLRKLGAGAGTSQSADERLLDAPVLSASSMLRTALARQVAFDMSFSSGEDADFLVRYLRGREYLQDKTPLYCYREYASFSLSGLRTGLAAERCRRLKHAAGMLARAGCWGRWGVKRVIYECAIAARGEDFVVRRRCTRLPAAASARWEAGREQVAGRLAGLEGALN